jgi:aconitate hydratase
MGILPLQFLPKENPEALGLDGTETYQFTGIAEGLEPHAEIAVTATNSSAETTEFSVEARIDSEVEMDYYRHGGVLQYVLRKMLTT